MSDLHIGARHVCYDTIKRDLEEARRLNARILINGDVMDMVLPRDLKRFGPEVAHPEIASSSHPIAAQVNMAYEVLAPYKDLIDMIGTGNHEDAVRRHHSIDPSLLLVTKLWPGGEWEQRYGGYTGFVDYRCHPRKRGKADGNTRRLLVFYHHGHGGSAVMTHGLLNLGRKKIWIGDADIIWEGHRHKRVLEDAVQKMTCPLSGYKPKFSDQLAFITGGYLQTIAGQDPATLERDGRVASYAEDSGSPPLKLGGFVVAVHWGLKQGIERLRLTT